jgi:hypothetical protein
LDCFKVVLEGGEATEFQQSPVLQKTEIVPEQRFLGAEAQRRHGRQEQSERGKRARDSEQSVISVKLGLDNTC